MRVGLPTHSPYGALFRGTNLVLTSSYGQCCKATIGLIRVELRCTHYDWYPLQRFIRSYNRICDFNVSILCIGVLMFHLKTDTLKLQILSFESLNLRNGSHSWCVQRSSTLINPIITLQHCPYELVSTKFVLLKSTSYGGCVGAPTRIVLPFTRTTDTLKVQILSCDVLCH